MRTRSTVVALSAVLAAVCSAPALAAGSDTDTPQDPRPAMERHGLAAIGLTSDQRLVEFDVEKPSKTWALGKVSGLTGDTKLVGIDFRVQNEKLYGVGDKGGIYTLNTENAKAMKVSQLTVALAGTAFGVDFNPAANRLRVISNMGQNLRHNVDDNMAPTAVDGVLTNPTTPPSTAMGVTGAAYTNNDLNAATATTLFDLDTMADRISLQSPANAGTLAPTGNLGVDAALDAGFDIYYNVKSGSNKGFAAIDAGSGYGLYEINLLNGQASSRGAFPKQRQVTDIALPLNQK